MWKKLVLLAVIAGTVTEGWRRWKQAHDRTVLRRRHATQDVQRWESEGGSLPPEAELRTDRARP